MSVQRKSNDSVKLPSPPSSSTTSTQEAPKEQAPAPKPQSTPIQGSLAQMVRSMSQTRYSDWEDKGKKKEEWQQLSRGDGVSSDSAFASESTTQKSSPMAAMFLSVGSGFEAIDTHDDYIHDDAAHAQHARNLDEATTEENFEDGKLSKAFLHGSFRPQRANISGQSGSSSTGMQAAGGIQGAKKKQNVAMNQQVLAKLDSERTFGFVALGATELLTPGGKEIRLLDKDLFQIHHPGGGYDEIQLRNNQIIITDESGQQLHQPIPVSLILSDGTKLTVGPDCELAVTNRELFAHISQGRVEKNNRSVLSGGIVDEMVAQGLSQQEASKRLDDAGSQILHLVPDDIHADDLADFNAADLDYMFRDGAYLVRSSEGAWTTDPSVATFAAKDAMQEARLSDTIWRMGIFCIEAEEILSDLLILQSGVSAYEPS